MTPEQERRFFADERSRSAFRQRMLDQIPSWYSPWLHFAGTAGVGVVALAAAIHGIEQLAWVELVTVPTVWLLSNLAEWHAHRHLLHRRWKPMAVLYDRHTPEHHRVYRYRDMAIRERKELRLILIPAMGVLGIVLAAAPGALLAGVLINANVGWLFLAASASYVVSYEITHLCYHLPEDSFIGRRAFIRFMREHHARHHDPRLMQKWNFNVTVPFGDWVFGTIASDALVESLSPDEESDRAPEGADGAESQSAAHSTAA
ncbi:MAG: sterol desaturase family protein [Polyangiaceae bacterium]